IDWDNTPLALLNEPTPWPRRDTPRRAGISSFGISGTNAHIIIEEPPAATPATVTGHDDRAVTRPRLEDGADDRLNFALSARTPEDLRAAAHRLRTHLVDHPEVALATVSRTLADRHHFAHRAVVLTNSRGALLAALSALTDLPVGTTREIVELPDATLTLGQKHPGSDQPVFIFPGQGSQWPGMALDLLHTSPAFTEHWNAATQALAPHITWNPHHALTNPELLTHPNIVQPLLWAIQTSLAHLWKTHGITPAAVIGHSQGEIAAATTAGILTLHDAAHLITTRSTLITTLNTPGAMLTINLPHTHLNLPPHTDIHIAAINSPTSTVLAGNPHHLQTYADQHPTTFSRLIPVTYASHTPHVEPLHTPLT
ncbi:acyltransferase domain-containing protein, partial [Frankia sp. Ag45/Mut15]